MMKWKTYHIGELFEVKRPSARNKDDYKDGDVPFVASGACNNGVMKCCKPKIDDKLDDAGCITVSPVDGSSFFQPYDFLGRGGAGSSVLMLYNDCVNEKNGVFVARMISQTCSKYSYGHMGNKDSIKRETIQLPVNEDEHIDWNYMSDRVGSIRTKMLLHYKQYVKKQINELNHRDIPELNEVEWCSYNISDVFPEISRGKRLKKADHIQGNVPYVSSTALNNGVDGFIEATPGTRVFNDCISLANSGSVGSTFYEPFEYVASDHVTHLKKNGLSKWAYLFLATMIEKQGVNFNFNREINDTRIRRMRIMLPSDIDGEPDFNYMEQYSKNMMLKKYNQYLLYIDNNEL